MGTFIARISRGRTIRDIVVGVILVPSVVSWVWFAVLPPFGDSEPREGGGQGWALKQEPAC